MMTKQSLDFITGYVFSEVEGRIKHAHANKVERMLPVYVYVPKSWFGLRPIKSKLEDLTPSVRANLLTSLGELCRAYNSEQSVYDFYISIEPDEQYIRFIVEGARVSAAKEMTVADIEKELGYKIKIIGEY